MRKQNSGHGNCDPHVGMNAKVNSFVVRSNVNRKATGYFGGSAFTMIRKIRAPTKNKIGTSPPPPLKPKIPPPLKRGILWTWVFPAEERIFPGVRKIDAPISGPRIADRNFMDTKRIFLITDLLAMVCNMSTWAMYMTRHAGWYLRLFVGLPPVGCGRAADRG